ncbi:TIGR00270 family protein [Methanosarcinales archaeon]|nr:MAG: TIGR00270 family protein [Methanosarcinales archaeon]
MQCEICGKEIKGEAQYVTIGSSELMVCKSCARYGTIVEEKKAKVAKSRVKSESRLYEQMDHEIEERMEGMEDHGRKIKEAREKAGLKQAELAKRINEKQSLLRKIENEEIIPTDEVRRKIERVLDISLSPS